MKRSSLGWNLGVAGSLLAGALATAVGCPASKPAPVAPAAKASPAVSVAPDAAPRTWPPEEAANLEPPAENPADLVGGPLAANPQSPPSEPPHAPQQPATAESAAESSTPAPAAEPLFADWPAPKFVIAITGRQHGYIEPCGCSGLANQKGGLARRHTFLQQLQARGWNVLAVDTGDQVRRYGRQAEIQFQITAQALDKMSCQVVALGADDLRLSSGELIAVVTDTGGKPGPFVCANANLFGLTKTHRLVEAGGERIAITAVLGADQLAKLQSAEIEKSSAEEGLRKVVPQMEAAGCDLMVLLANAGYEESKALAEKFPQFQVVIAAAGSGEPPRTAEKVGQTQLILVAEKAMYAGVLGVFDDPQQRFRYQRAPLDKQYADSSYMLKLLATYQDTLQQVGLDGLGLRAVQHPSGNAFVGSARCGDCHTKAYEVWKNTPHSHATETLVHPPERSEISRHHDPECLSCHVTGWDPQGYFPFKSGYVDLEKSSNLLGNGCENCHGPGSRHAAAEAGESSLDAAAIGKLREEMRLPLAQAEKKCVECHDLDNDPEFVHDGAFLEYWKKIAHPGKD